MDTPSLPAITPANITPRCEGCGGPLPPRTYRGGSIKRTCSPTCRIRVWRAARTQSVTPGGDQSVTLPAHERKRMLIESALEDLRAALALVEERSSLAAEPWLPRAAEACLPRVREIGRLRWRYEGGDVAAP